MEGCVSLGEMGCEIKIISVRGWGWGVEETRKCWSIASYFQQKKSTEVVLSFKGKGRDVQMPLYLYF